MSQPTESIQLSAEECRRRVLEFCFNEIEEDLKTIQHYEWQEQMAPTQLSRDFAKSILPSRKQRYQESKQVLEWLENAINR